MWWRKYSASSFLKKKGITGCSCGWRYCLHRYLGWFSTLSCLCCIYVLESKKKKRTYNSSSGVAGKLVQAQESFSSVFSTPLSLKKKVSSSGTNSKKPSQKPFALSSGVRKTKGIKNLSLSQQEKEFCNSQNLSQLLDNEQLWASDASDTWDVFIIYF